MSRNRYGEDPPDEGDYDESGILAKPETGFEPVTYRLQGGCSGQLSYSGGVKECRGHQGAPRSGRLRET